MEISKPGQTESDVLKAMGELSKKDLGTLDKTRTHVAEQREKLQQTLANIDGQNEKKYANSRELQKKLTEILKPYLTGPVSKKSSGEYISEFTTPVSTMKIVKTTEGIYLESKLGTNFLYQKLEETSFEELQAQIKE